MGKRKGTPGDLDYLFERNIIDEEDYADFWEQYWSKKSEDGRQQVINDFLEMADEGTLGFGTQEKIAGVVTKNKMDAKRQAATIGGRVVRRNKLGRFSKRGRFYQAVKKGTKKKK